MRLLALIISAALLAACTTTTSDKSDCIVAAIGDYKISPDCDFVPIADLTAMRAIA